VQGHLAHQQLHRATRNGKAFPHHLAPDLPYTLNREVHGENAGDLGLEGKILAGPR
jgi:hypothetical protein